MDRSEWTLKLVLEVGGMDHMDLVEEVVALAARELTIEHALDDIEDDSKQLILKFEDHYDTGDLGLDYGWVT